MSIEHDETNRTLTKPAWIRSALPSGTEYFRLRRDFRGKNLFTVCEEAKCPNIGECWKKNTATFMVLGDECSRNCKFCNVTHRQVIQPVNNDEPKSVALAAQLMKLKYVVITMVTRDDLEDGGANHVAEVIREIRRANPGILVELLISDMDGNRESIKVLLNEKPEVIGHNVEVVKALTAAVRDPKASYERSLQVLRQIKELASYPVLTKSGFMLGLGESGIDIDNCFNDLNSCSVDFVTIGQYLQPSRNHLPVRKYYSPDEFASLKDKAAKVGFKAIAAGPFVRSSYKAHELYLDARAG